MDDHTKKFCDEYLKDGNITRAYIAAFPEHSNRHSASTLGGRLLKKVEVQKYLSGQVEEMHDADIADAKEMRQVLTSIIRQKLDEDTLMNVGVGEGMTEVKHFNKKAALKDVIKSIETLARLDGLFDDKATVNLCVPVFTGDDELEE